jgi:hypothetical protein
VASRRWATVALAAQVLFVLSWLVAASWQGPRYNVLAHTISDMYADGAPGGIILVVVITLCGSATIMFTARSVWPSLRPGGWRATLGSILLGLSIFGLGDLLTPLEREACRLADLGCTAAAQVATFGGVLDALLSSIGVALFVTSLFFLASAMTRAPGWEPWSRPARWTAVLFLVLIASTGALEAAGLGGLFERLLAFTGAAAIGILAHGVLEHTRKPTFRGS